jgi:hypothetical protein
MVQVSISVPGMVSITIVSVFQDEVVGSSPDAFFSGDFLQLRSERDGNGDGRVYHISFIASDGQGGTCKGVLKLGVTPHDQGSSMGAIDGGALYDSTVAQ